MTKRHRLLRRGRIYGQPLDEQFIIDNIIDKAKQSPLWQEENDDQTRINNSVRGLHFICLVSDIGRQFEFVQNVWANTATFGNLYNEVDPLISPRPTADQPECDEFTAPKETFRNRYTKVPQFTTVIGGAYFFLPGIAALKYIIKP
jgi:deferrochelatase/peroxidase EfeB